MANTNENSKVNFYFDKAKNWQQEIEMLREIILKCELEEVLKWGVPCYTFQEKNIVLIHLFKEYCAVLFIKGALLKDSKKILVQQTENVQAARQIRFTNLSEIKKLKSSIVAYVNEAITIEKAGIKVELKKPAQFKMADEFKIKLEKNPVLKTTFESLTPGRQRAYLLYFSAPKQSKTRESRVEKCVELIMDGKGLND